MHTREHASALAREYSRLGGLELELEPTALLACFNTLGNRPVSSHPPRALLNTLTAAVGKQKALQLSVMFAKGCAEKPLDDEQFKRCAEQAELLSASLQAHQRQIETLASTVSSTCPNVQAVVGDAYIAAELLLKYPLDVLQRTPPSNLVNLQTSPLASSSLIKSVPPRVRKSALRVLASKVVLAARVDLSSSTTTTDGTTDTNETTEVNDAAGRRWRAEVESKIDRLLAPPPAMGQRALPKPLPKAPSRRGGQRARRQRERRQPNELQQKQNIVRFG